MKTSTHGTWPTTTELALHLMRIASPSGHETSVCAELESFAQLHQLRTRRIGVDENRYNLLVCGAEKPHALLTTHVDTVPGGPALKLEDGVLHGRGACDAKGIAAAMLAAMHDLHGLGENRVGALFVVGEETCSDGAKAAAKALEPMQFIINGEPTELKLVRAQKGALALRLSTTGVAAHSGYPELGSSAIHTLLDALHQIRSQTWPSDPEMGPTFVNVGSLRGGTAANVLANHAQADLMLRVVTAPEKIAEQICALLDPYTRVELLTQSGPQHLYVPPGRDSIVVGYASDVAHLRPLGPLLMVGPGSIHVAHTDHEKIQVADLEQARILYRELCLELLTKGLQ